MTYKTRHLYVNEKLLIAELLNVAQCEFDTLDDVTVTVIDDYTGTIRSSHLEEKQRIKAVSDTHFFDTDGGYVEVVLFIDANQKFGELFIWKADGTRLLRLPQRINEFYKIKTISRS